MLQLNKLRISWFGGEPLLAKDVIFAISDTLSELSALYSVDYKASITTNGYYLDRETLTSLVGIGVLHYQVTLDGPRDVHNLTRVTQTQGETFDRIWSNLLDIRSSVHPVEVLLRVHYSAQSVRFLGPLVEAIREEFIRDSRFRIHFHAIQRLGGPNDADIGVLSRSEEMLALSEYKEMLFGHPDSQEALSSDFIDTLNSGFICYAARPNSLLIRADGSLGKCTVALNDERNTVGRILDNGKLELDKRRLQPWFQGLKSMDQELLACPLQGLP
jgi:uncharacterized protein